MEFFETLQNRHSIRAFRADPLTDSQRQKIFEAINSAPSAGNLQACEVYVVTEPAHKQALVQAAYAQEFIAQAPLVLVFCANPARSAVRYAQRGESLYCIQDATIACTFAMLAATALGLGSVWVGAFDEEAVAAGIHAAPGHRPVAMLPIGIPDQTPRIRPRRAQDDLFHPVSS